MTSALAYPPVGIEARNHRCKMYLRSFLSSLFASACRLAKQVFPTGTMVSYRGMAREFYDFFADQSQRDDFYQETVVNTKGHSTKVHEAFRMLQDSLKQHCYDWPATSCPLLILMDEAHMLFESVDIYSGQTLFSHLNSVLRELVSEDFCVIFISTSTCILEVDVSEATARLCENTRNMLFHPHSRSFHLMLISLLSLLIPDKQP